MWMTMGGDVTADRLSARATRLDAFADRRADDLDAYVRREARALRDEYRHAGVRVGKRDEPAADELAYTVEILTIEPHADGEGTRSVTLDVTATITERDAFRAYDGRVRAARENAARFRRRAVATENGHEDSKQTTIVEYLR